jgi:exodeoxyribonuclease VII large subunit
VQRDTELNRDLLSLVARDKAVRIYTVSELTAEIKEKLEQGFPCVWVTGEVSNVRRPASGHVYLTLKDEEAQISVVIWRSYVSRIPFEIRDGLAVIVQAEVSVYPPQGHYQLTCRQIYPKGIGPLDLALRQLKEKLQKEGLFAEERKRPLPFLPRRIGVVTSPSGAALRDMLKVLGERCPFVPILIHPTRVQGEGAGQEIADAIARVSHVPGIDVLIVGRGGGSLEDLWAFNEEAVARAICASRVPVVSAVGHEIDLTIADLVADVRAPTPTYAAQCVVPDRRQLAQQLDALRDRLSLGLRLRLQGARESLLALAQSYALRQPFELVRREERHLDDLCERLAHAGRLLLPDRWRAFDAVAARLKTLGPRNVLARGYSITILEKDGKIVRKASQAAKGDCLTTLLFEGALHSTVDSTSSGAPHGGKEQ